MNRVMLAAALVAATTLGGGCYLKAARSNNPLRSQEGVQLRLIGQDCEDHSGGDGDPVSRDLAVKLELRNPTRDALLFAPDLVSLSVGGATVAAAHGGDEYQIAPGEARTFELRFTHHALCAQDFALAFDSALRLGTQPVAMATLHFTPY